MNKSILALVLLITTTCLWAFDQSELRSGDVLLISFNCYECRVIESETNSSFSHSGVIIKNENSELRVGQSIGSVALYTLGQFLKNRTPETKVAVYRPKEFLYLDPMNTRDLERRMLETFNSKFKGAPFDVRYLWDNFDKEGRELLYCSEFVAKFLDQFLSETTVPFPLTYKKNADYWFTYFKGDVPEGVMGNSPSSFITDERFIFVGNL